MKTAITDEQTNALRVYDVVETHCIDGKIYFYARFSNRRNFLSLMLENGVSVGFDTNFKRGFEEIIKNHENIMELVEVAMKNGAVAMEINQFLSSIKFRDANEELFSFVLAYKDNEAYMRHVSSGERVRYIK